MKVAERGKPAKYPFNFAWYSRICIQVFRDFILSRFSWIPDVYLSEPQYISIRMASLTRPAVLRTPSFWMIFRR